MSTVTKWVRVPSLEVMSHANAVLIPSAALDVRKDIRFISQAPASETSDQLWRPMKGRAEGIRRSVMEEKATKEVSCKERHQKKYYGRKRQQKKYYVKKKEK